MAEHHVSKFTGVDGIYIWIVSSLFVILPSLFMHKHVNVFTMVAFTDLYWLQLLNITEKTIM